MQNSKLLENIGRSLLICQHIEAALALALLYERKDKLRSPEHLISEFAKLRSGVLESLKNELKQKNATYLDFDEIDLVIDKRNWFVHRLTLDPRMIAIASGRSGDDLEDVLAYFLSAYTRISKACIQRAKDDPKYDSNAPDQSLYYIVAISTAIANEAEARIQAKKKK